MGEPSFRTLLHRYFFINWLFKDVSRGTVFERAAAWRYNQGQAHWLDRYVRRWIVVAGLLLSLGVSAEVCIGNQFLSAFFYVPGVASLPVSGVVGVIKLGLRVMPGPL